MDFSVKAMKRNREDKSLQFDKLDYTPNPLPPLKRGYNETLEQTVMRILRASGAVSNPVVDDDFEDDDDELYDDLEESLFDAKPTQYEVSGDENVSSVTEQARPSSAATSKDDIQQPAPQSQDKGSLKSEATQAFDPKQQTQTHSNTVVD